MPKSNRSQAMLLKKADMIPNDNGSALGMHFFEKSAHIFIMPGVPDEMKGMVQNYIIPQYMKNEPFTNQVTIKTAGIMESRLAEKIAALMKKYSATFRFSFLPHYNGVSFRMQKKENSNFKDYLQKKIIAKILGPVNAPIYKIKKNYRIRLLIRSKKEPQIQKSLSQALQKFKFSSGIKLTVDVDPITFN